MFIIILSTLSATLSGFLLVQSLRTTKQYRFPSERLKDLDLSHTPSVTICIPARNETSAMTSCLEAVISSDYPKLEIIVLDDDSVDNTSTLIKSFAHTGVRFIKGAPLQEGWMGRNYAYQNLLEAASGKYIFFMSVDIHIDRGTISQFIKYLINHEAEMISILPIRRDSFRPSTLFSPLRFFNDLILSTKYNPPTASSAWIVNRDLFREYADGFSAYKNNVSPESQISKAFVAKNQYSFLISPFRSSVNDEKNWKSQIETSLRIHALTRSESFLARIAYLLSLAILIAPTFILTTSIIAHQTKTVVFITTLLTELVLMLSYFIYVRLTRPKGNVLQAIIFPLILVQELIIFVISIVKKSFGTITWKGRNIYPKNPKPKLP